MRKKDVFSCMNFILSDMNIHPMHYLADRSMEQNDFTLFFGLSLTVKTTLSADKHCMLIGYN